MSRQRSYSAITVLSIEGVETARTGKANRDEIIASPNEIRINVVCLIGATFGIAAIALPWLWTEAGGITRFSFCNDQIWTSHWQILGIHDVPAFLGMNPYCLIFLAGTFIAFFTPMGAAAQIGGAGGFVWNEVRRENDLSIVGYDGGLSIGAYLAILSIGIVLLSFVLPRGPGFDSNRSTWKSRLWTFSRSTKAKWKMTAVGHAFGRARTLVLVWAVVAAMLATTTVAVDFSVPETEPLIEVADGVSLVVGPNCPYAGIWEMYGLALSTGTESVGWTRLNQTSAPSHNWTVEVFPERELSNLSVRLTILDVEGDGRAGPMDCVILTAENGTHFAADKEYSFKLLPILLVDHSYYSPLVPRMTVSFVFHDGHLSSWLSVNTMPYLIL